LLRAVPDYVPAWRPEQFELLEIWRGLRPCSPDGLPFLGRSTAWKNLTVAAGHAMIGLSLGPVTGEIVAQLVTGAAPGFDLQLCRVERFG
jgi:D-amino-acid dehydrogenase